MVPRSGFAPLSFAQERLWFLNRLEPDSAAYNVAIALRLEGALDVAALERALGAIVRRHEVLRTTFQEHDGVPVQVIAPFTGFALPLEDLSTLGVAEREADVQRRVKNELARPYDLARGPLLRHALFRLAMEEHVLLLGLHHAVTDVSSRNLLFRELALLYDAHRQDAAASPLPALPMQYAEYAVWQRETLIGETLARHVTYWRTQLAGAPTLLPLPTDAPRPAVKSHRGMSERIEMPVALTAQLQALARQERASLFMALLGAFQVLLSKYSGTDDVVVGSPIAGRRRQEAEELIGFFVNTLALRTDLRGDPTFREVLRRVREVTLSAYKHQDLPFEQLVAELQPERSLSRSPLFQVMLSLGPPGDSPPELSGLRVSNVPVDSEATDFDLLIRFAANADGLRADLIYSTDLFRQSTAQRMLRHLVRTLEQVTANADIHLSELTLLDAAEQHQVLTAWNQTAAAHPAERCLHELFEAEADRRPAAVAVVSEGEILTYRELNARADRLAHDLARVGVGPEVRVGLCAERSADLIVSMLGVLKAGGAFVPLATNYPADRLAFMLRDAEVRVLVIQERFRALLPESAGIVALSIDDAVREIEAAVSPLHRAVPASLCYVMFTSGSTGRPKGVMVTHGNVVNFLSWARGAFGIGPETRLAQVTTPSFDISVLELLLPLIAGGRVVIVSDDDRSNARRVAERLVEHGATLMQTTPSVWRSLLENGWRAPDGFQLLSGGEELPADLAGALVGASGRAWNLYGPTETTIWSCAHRLEPAALGRIPIGRPLANTQAYVVDDRGRPLPVGVPGELWLGGTGVARGYHARAALTAERFVPDPFGAHGGRLYRTGDRARWRADGTLEFLGRLDAQVKVRGFRIEPGEIEAAMCGCSGIREACVIVRADPPGDSRLVAYVVGDVDDEGLRRHLRQTLPDYMIPSAFVRLTALPLTPTGKLDRAALPTPDPQSGRVEHFLPPRTPVEERLAAIWAEVLRRDRVSVTDDFFELGGHSLAAMRVASRIYDDLAIEIPIRMFFERPTIGELAVAVEDLRAIESA